jgi:raffinose/stachyose/melibiose transport system permease protein
VFHPSEKLLKKTKQIISTAILIIVSVLVLYPFIWTFFASLKTNPELYANTWGPPLDPQWSNYEVAWTSGRMGTCFVNSVIVTAAVVGILAIISPMAAYVLASYEFRGKKMVFYGLIAGMLVAPHVAIVPLYVLLQQLGVIDTYFALILTHVAWGLPYSTFIARAGFLGIPKSIEESARVDGLSTFQIYRKIMLPLAAPAVAVALILQAIFVWNDFLFPLIFLRSSDLFTLPLGLVVFRGMYIIRYGPLSAGVIISSIPLIAFYVFLSDYVKKGISLGGALKG